jgi:hypothetical protein
MDILLPLDVLVLNFFEAGLEGTMPRELCFLRKLREAVSALIFRVQRFNYDLWPLCLAMLRALSSASAPALYIFDGLDNLALAVA